MPTILNPALPRNFPFRLNCASPQARGLRVWYPIIGSGTYLRDWSGHGHHIVLPTVDTIAHTSVHGGEYAVHSAGNSTGTAPAGEANLLDIPLTYNFAMTLWVAHTTFATNQAAMTFGGTDDLLVYPYDVTNGNGPRVFWRDVGSSLIDINSGLPAADGLFHHMAFVSYASNDHRFFVDGALIASSTATGTAGPFTSFRIMVWADSTSQRYGGSAFDFRLYDQAPSPGVIAQMYAPATRWDLYEVLGYRKSRRAVSVAGAASGSATGAAAGTSTAAAVGTSRAQATAAAAGAGVASATGRSQAQATGASTGSGAATAVGLSVFHGQASSVGAATVAATGLSAFFTTGTSAGSAVATATGRSLASTTASAAGVATVLGVAFEAGSVAAASGGAIVTAGGSSRATAEALAGGVATVLGIGEAVGGVVQRSRLFLLVGIGR